jgi:iron complex transport system ATP-binding protein
MKPLFSFCDVTFGYGDCDIIRSATFDLPEGSCTALIGPNGAGKTTLLRLAAGTLQCRSGKVILSGAPLQNRSLKEVARMVALVPQQLDVPFQFTVREVVEQGRTPYLGLLRGPMSEDRVMVDRALDLADITRLQKRIFNELSGGERQRVKIALGLAEPQATFAGRAHTESRYWQTDRINGSITFSTVRRDYGFCFDS